MSCTKLADLIELGQYKFSQEVSTRKAMLGSTAVNFSLFGAVDQNKKEGKNA